MKHSEIKNKFDEIVAFSEIEKFLDEPVKRFSSGMYVRLAFSVAAHLDPDILIVDEVLAVGDTAFQKKCIGKMEDVATKQDRTILFVSHDMAAVTALCQRGIWLLDGKISCDSDIESATKNYLNLGTEKKGDTQIKLVDKEYIFKFEYLAFHDSHNNIKSQFDVREPIILSLKYITKSDFNNIELSVRINNSRGVAIFTINRSASNSSQLSSGYYDATIRIPSHFLAPDTYTVDIGAHVPLVEVISYHQSLLSFEVVETGSGMSLYQGKQYGVVLVSFEWIEDTIPVNAT